MVRPLGQKNKKATNDGIDTKYHPTDTGYVSGQVDRVFNTVPQYYQCPTLYIVMHTQ